LGQLLGTVRAENELWASLVLLSDGLADMVGREAGREMERRKG
jgi:hypothetical protein